MVFALNVGRLIVQVDLGREGWKDRYYSSKVPGEDPANMVKAYLEGLVWVMKYYYQGCASWTWFYPFHYAPFASDLPTIDSVGGSDD